jgi:hypothetical protein
LYGPLGTEGANPCEVCYTCIGVLAELSLCGVPVTTVTMRGVLLLYISLDHRPQRGRKIVGLLACCGNAVVTALHHGVRCLPPLHTSSYKFIRPAAAMVQICRLCGVPVADGDWQEWRWVWVAAWWHGLLAFVPAGFDPWWEASHWEVYHWECRPHGPREIRAREAGA